MQQLDIPRSVTISDLSSILFIYKVKILIIMSNK